MVDPVKKTHRVLLVQRIVQVNPYCVHTQGFRPAQFPVNGDRVVGLFLPHLQLVNGVTWCKVSSHQPFLILIPSIRLFFCPDRPIWLRFFFLCFRTTVQQYTQQYRHKKNPVFLHDLHLMCYLFVLLMTFPLTIHTSVLPVPYALVLVTAMIVLSCSTVTLFHRQDLLPGIENGTDLLVKFLA